LKITSESDTFISIQLMIAEGRVDGNVFLAPDGGLAVPDLPVARVVAPIDEVASEADKRGIGCGDGADERDAHGRVRDVGILRIVEAAIAIGDEAKRGAHRKLQIGGGGLSDRLLRATCAEQGCRKARKQPSAGEASARSFHRRVLVGSPPVSFSHEQDGRMVRRCDQRQRSGWI